jgi:hypothetical protein
MPARSTARLTALAATTCAALLLGLTGTASAADTLNCDGGPSGAGAGVACESLRLRSAADVNESADRVTTTTTTTTPPPPTTTAAEATTTPAVTTSQKPAAPADAAPAAAADRDCADFPTQAEAQAALAPGDPERLDADSDGIACEEQFGTENQQAVAPTATADRDCADFPTQAEAQAALAPGDPERLDADSDGIACEEQFGTEDQQVAVHPVGGVATGGTPLR